MQAEEPYIVPFALCMCPIDVMSCWRVQDLHRVVTRRQQQGTKHIDDNMGPGIESSNAFLVSSEQCSDSTFIIARVTLANDHNGDIAYKDESRCQRASQNTHLPSMELTAPYALLVTFVYCAPFFFHAR